MIKNSIRSILCIFIDIYVYFVSVSSSTTAAYKLSNYKYNTDSSYSSPSKLVTRNKK